MDTKRIQDIMQSQNEKPFNSKLQNHDVLHFSTLTSNIVLRRNTLLKNNSDICVTDYRPIYILYKIKKILFYN